MIKYGAKLVTVIPKPQVESFLFDEAARRVTIFYGSVVVSSISAEYETLELFNYVAAKLNNYLLGDEVCVDITPEVADKQYKRILNAVGIKPTQETKTD